MLHLMRVSGNHQAICPFDPPSQGRGLVVEWKIETRLGRFGRAVGIRNPNANADRGQIRNFRGGYL